MGKGLKFCPTPPMYDNGVLKENIDKFFRSASLKLSFDDTGVTESIDLEDYLKIVSIR